MEIINRAAAPRALKAAVFDFDGTVSTLRCGWEQVMGPMMLEFITAADPAADAADEVARYIDQSTGIQTVYQMQWLAERVAAAGGPERDAWWYKDEYNRRLMARVAQKKEALKTGKALPGDYTVAGAAEFVRALKNAGLELYLASGTDHADVLREAALLGVDGYFTGIKGAPERAAACSKEAVLTALLEEKHIPGERLLVVGDGKVEIALGKKYGAFALGAATDEASRRGVNEVKRQRLIAAGADAVTGDFTDLPALLAWLHIGG